MEHSKLQAGWLFTRLVKGHPDADMIIFLVGSVDLDFVYYAKAAQQCSTSANTTTPAIDPPREPKTNTHNIDDDQHNPNNTDTKITCKSTVNTCLNNTTSSSSTLTNNNNNNDDDTTGLENDSTDEFFSDFAGSPFGNDDEQDLFLDINVNAEHKTINTTNSYTNPNLPESLLEETDYATDRLFHYLDTHIIPIVSAQTKLVLNSVHPPTLDDRRNAGRLNDPTLMGNLYHSLVGITLPPLPTHALRTEACMRFNENLRAGAYARGLTFMDVASSMISETTKVIKPYFVRTLPYDVHIEEEVALPIYVKSLQNIDERWVITDKQKQQVWEIEKKLLDVDWEITNVKPQK